MTTMTLAVPNELKEEMEAFPEINWSEVARQAFQKKVSDLALFRKFSEKSNLTYEDSLRMGKSISHVVSDKLRKKVK